MDRSVVEAAVAEAGGNMSAAARKLGVARSTVQRAMGRRAVSTREPGRAKRAGALTMGDILEEFNIADKLMKFIGALEDDEFKRESDMAQAAPSRTAWEKAKKKDSVKACQVKLPDGTSVWGKPKDAEVLRRKLLEF